MPRAGAVWVDVLPNMSGFGRSLNQQIGEPVAQASRSAGETGGTGLMEGMAGKMKAGALAAGAVVGALVAKGIGEAIEKQAATGKLKAQLGLSPKEAKTAGAAAGKLYADAVTGSIDEGAQAVRAIMAAGLAPEKATTKQLASMATKVQDLSSLFELDLGQTANSVGQILKTGLAKDGNEALDTLFAGMQKLGPRADDVADTFNEYSTIFRSLGLDVQTTMGMFSQGMQAGARDTDVIADSLKEFQIRATDGSKASAEGFEALGLNAKDMTAQIAGGGKGASAGLQLVLDKLRNMKDPVERNAAAVGLFGTKAEDMAGALWALDPSKATDDLGKVGGAAKKAGDDLRDNAGVSFEQFKRRALMTLGDVATKYVIPPLMKFGRFLNDDVVPPVKTATTWLGDKLTPVVRGVGDVVSGTINWFKEFGIWLAPLGVIVGGLTLMLSANALATAGVTAAFSVYRGVILAWTAVQRTAIAVQTAWNTVMALNPIGLVVIALVALGVALVVAWKKSETFRNIVLGAWEAIKTGALWLWENGIKPMVDGFMAGVRMVGQWASWLWGTVLSPVFSAISTGARILATILAIVVFGPIYLGVKVLGAIFSWLWSAAIKPVFGWIVAGAQLWWAGVKLYFSLVWGGLKTVGGWFKWLYTNAVKPVFNWIVATLKLAWSGVKTVFGWFTTGLKTVGSWFKWLYDNGVKPAFNAIKTVVSNVYNTGVKPVFDKLKSATGKVSDAFGTAKDAIKKAWDKVKGIAKAPVKFVIDTVYNNGVVKVWNAVAEKFGAPTLDPITGFARGGVLPGQSSYRQGDDQLVPMRRGEGVAVSEAMRDPYERARLLAVNKAAMRGQSLRPFQGGGFAKGGIFDWVKGAASKGVDLAKSGFDWLKDGIKDSAVAGLNAVVKPLIDKISGSASVYRDMVSGIPKRMIKTIVGYSGDADKEMEKAGIGGGSFKKALSWARTQAGLKYQWGGNGNPSWDCSGFVSAIESVIRGQKPHRRWATGAFSGATAPGGWVLNKKSPYMIGITNAGVGHTAGTINGTNVESRGGDGVVVGARARSYRDSMFTHHYGFAAKGYADGGKPKAGEVAWVGEQGPELVKFKGGEEVYNTRDSMRMWEGVGARGFAKGTASSRAKARKDLPGDLTAFTKSLTGSAATIAKASKELVKDLKAAGIGSKGFIASVTKASKRLQDMARLRDGLGKRIAAGRQAADDQRKSATDYLGLSQLGEVTDFAGLLGSMQNRQADLKTFQGQIAGLAKKGLSQGLISQLVEQGPGGPLIDMVSRANKAQIKQLNSVHGTGSKLATSYGRTMADSMHDAGKDAAKGFLTGLIAQEKEIKAAMAKLGASAVKAIRSKKGIDARSPSRKGAEAGRDLGAGLVAGMVAAGPSIESAAARLGASAVPAGVVPVTSGASSGSASSGLPSGPLYLVVEDGTVLRAYVSDRVDEGLDDVRRAKRAGSKK
ncbi:phage tail tape measure protein [Streptomyces sp. M2CJ-2]|uniref:phage tail tape measure protein n=1 Tax=Streptomyces sp. M2CJ-2 TaxID=2803948 RepID=UPI001928433B|nr:phage tail tape measure protein [Streptomyces sp. M2CJ-2]MBL3670813.1 phage tail tape measure protein [Streptomyces sp. M2CJ-2]